MADPRPATVGRADTCLALGGLAVLGILIVPVPAPALDFLLALSVGVALLMLLTALGLTRALDFSVFPSLLLIITLFRLSLNVATTRLILLRGGEGAGAAGHLIETFGRFAVGGSLVVGLVIFLILLVVNFAVISKGANRVSEVAARFTLDAMPGKQMSIDADLAAGLLRDHLSLSQAVETYSLLTVGDGLVSQLPALLVSTSSGIVVTRAAGDHLASQVGKQIFGRPRALATAAYVLGALGLLPGMPLFAFAGVGGGLWLLGRRAARAT